MKELLQIFDSLFVFGGMMALLLLIFLVPFPLLLIAVVLSCWVFRWLRNITANILG